METKCPEPECEEVFTIIDTDEVGDVFECEGCGEEIEITSLDPFEAKLVEQDTPAEDDDGEDDY